MILGGSGCQKCSCVPCDPCEQECTEPHTGDPFEVVYTRFFEGVEAGNPTDGYLTATGDSDTDDPYDGMDGSAPWYQQVSGSFSFGPGVTRHPCSINISFWRNSYALGPATVPPAGSTLTYEKIKVTCNTGKIFVGETILEAGQEYESPQEIPVVAGTGDQSGSDPVTYYGTISVRPVCREASFSVQARIEWETQKRQHVLYGKVRECYEDPENPPCANGCDGDGVPDTVYVTISNFQMDPDALYYGPSVAGVNGTYALSRETNICNAWVGPETGDACRPLFPEGVVGQWVETGPDRYFVEDMAIRIRTSYTADFQNQLVCMDPLFLSLPIGTLPEICGSGVIASGEGATGFANVTLYTAGEGFSGNVAEVIACTFDWEIST